MSADPIVIIHDGMRRFVWPCSIDRCPNHCDPDGDVALLCVAHIAMVPGEMLDVLDTAEDWRAYAAGCQAVVRYVEAADAVING